MKKENEKEEKKEKEKILKTEQEENINIDKDCPDVPQEETVENAMPNEIKEEQNKNESQKTEKEEKQKTEKTEGEKQENKEEPNLQTKKSKKRIIIILFVLIILLLFCSTIFAVLNMNNSNVVKGVYIEELDVSDLKKDKINEIVNEKIGAIEEIELAYDNYESVVKLEEIGLTVNGKEAIKEAVTIGKTNNIIIDNFNILKSRILKTKLELIIEIDDAKLKEMVKNIQAEMPGAIKQYSYERKGDKLIVTRGTAGKVIKEEELKQQIIKNIKEQFNGEVKEITIPTMNAEPEEIDIDKIYKDIYKEAKDAYIEEEPFKLHKEEEGVTFKKSINEVKDLLKEEKETYTIPLKITKPRVAVKDLGNKLFKQTLSKYTTIYDSSNTNRASNIALAAKTINGTILLPGETFSYNGTLGNTTKEKGYKQGGAYVGGKIIQTYGGGICQVSSTLYNAVLYANLEIVERYNHSYSVTYVPAGRDATVSYGGKDFKFKNTRTYPIRIKANAKNGVVSIAIEGIKEDKEYEIELTSTVLSTTPCKIVYEKNSSLAEGKQKVIQVGHTGQKSIAYKIVKYNGKTISKEVLSKDTYKPMNRIVQVGTKKTQAQTN